MSVAAGGLYVGMAQKHLYDPDIRASTEGKRCEGVTAGMGRQTADGRLSFPKPVKEPVIVPGEIAGMPERSRSGAEYVRAMFGQGLYTVFQFRQQRNGAEACGGLCSMLYDGRRAILQLHRTIDRQSVLGDIPPLETQELATAQTSKQQEHNGGSNPGVIAGHSIVENQLDLLNSIGFSRFLSDSRGL